MKILTPGKDYPLDYKTVERSVKGTIFEGSDGNHYLRINMGDETYLACLNDSSLYSFDSNDEISSVYFCATSFNTMSLS